MDLEYQQKLQKHEWNLEERTEEYQQLLDQASISYNKKLELKKIKVKKQKDEIFSLKTHLEEHQKQLEDRLDDIWKLGEELKRMDDKITKLLTK